MLYLPNPLQIIVTAFALFALSRVILRARNGEISRKAAVAWSLIWIVLIAAVYFSRYLSFLEVVGGARRPIDVMMALSIILLFYLNFRLFVKLDNMEGEITKLVREIALGKKK